MERFNLKKLNNVEAVLEDWIQRWKLIVPGK
jgi:hypothetical protein